MAFREFRYFCGEAVKSIFYNFLMTLASVVTVTGCLLFLGAFTLFSLNLSSVADQVREECKLVAYVDSACSDSETEAIENKISKIEGISDITTETQAEALEGAKEMLGDAGVSLDGIEDDGFLRASFTVGLMDLTESSDIAEKLRGIEGIEEVREEQALTDRVYTVTHIVKIVLVCAMAVLALIAIFIISNSIKLAVFAREREIHIMKYVGATDWFIRWPFIIEGIIVGIVGALLSFGLCAILYGALYNATNGMLLTFRLYTFSEAVLPLLLLLLLFGSLMGAIGSIIAVRRHLQV